MSTVPPFGASTRAAALARRNAKSTVIGCSPTRPRTPSVPKYLRAIESFSQSHCMRDTHGIHRRGHLVGAHHTRSLENRNGGERDAPRQTVTDVTPRERREHRLARQAHQQRAA